MSVPSFLRHARSRRYPAGDASQAVSPLVRLWLLRMLVPLGTHRSFVDRAGGFANDALAEAVGLGEWVDLADGAFDASAARSALRQLHADAEQQSVASAPCSAVLAMNIQRLADLVGLSTADQAILSFAVHLHSDRLLDDTADWLGSLSSTKVFHVLSVVLDMPLETVRSALGTLGVLARSGLVSLDRSSNSTLRGKLELLSHNFADHIASDDAAPLVLLRDVVAQTAPPTLTLADYPHVQDSLAVLLPYLRATMESRRVGVNMFVHGAPGTGKSQLVKVLAEALGAELFEVASEDDDGDPVSGAQRLRAFRAAQSFFTARKAMMLFDEVEDVFNDHENHRGSRSTAQSRKAWINRTLESNPVPAFWLSNSVHCLDPAFVRRFDMIVELPVPPRHQRERILQSTCGTLLDGAMRQRLSESDRLAPAVVSRAAAVVQTIASDLGSQGCADAFQLLVNQTLKAQGHRTVAVTDASGLPAVYDPACTCADADLAQLTRGLVATRAGRLCLYGPPGTGKTAFGHWLAAQLGMPLLVRRASDLMSAYLGETEQAIARAFRQATQDGAVLLIDEVDSFLQDRRSAQRSWEVSQVNEMLTQMESFAGVFIASTNLMGQLDQAALRRFDLSVKFNYLSPNAARHLFEIYSKQLFHNMRKGSIKCKRHEDAAEVKCAHDSVHVRLARLQQLTPGDFAAVVRQCRLCPIESPLALVAALEKVCALKESGTRSPMGFVA
jgi:transitional endoplasmic reticulum ATPase